MTGKISVVIPLYNGRDYIAQAIESALQQTCPPNEIIVVDDGSTDQPKEVLQPFMDRIRYLRGDHRGVCAARNLGVREAKGEYIALLDQDDFWAAEKLAAQVEILDTFPDVGLVHTDVCVVYGHGNYKKTEQRFGFTSSFSYEGVFLKGHRVLPSAVMIRKWVYEKSGGFDESFPLFEDVEFFGRVISFSPIHCLSKPLTYYRDHARNTSKTDQWYKYRPVFLNKLEKMYAKDPRWRAVKDREWLWFYSDFGKYLVRQGKKKEGRRYLALAVLGGARMMVPPSIFFHAIGRLMKSYCGWLP